MIYPSHSLHEKRVQPYLYVLPFKVEASQAVIQSRGCFWRLLYRSVLLQLGNVDYSDAGL